MSHNKFMRRYNRHKTKHSEYFERLAREALQKGGTTVQFGSQRFTVEARKRPFRRWLIIARPDGHVIRRPDITHFADPVPVIADYLMQLAADIPGVEVPPSGAGSVPASEQQGAVQQRNDRHHDRDPD